MEHHEVRGLHAEHEDHPRQAHVRHMYVCYICGQEFGPTSLPIHQKSCPEKRHAAYRTVPHEFMPPQPTPPSHPVPGPDASAKEVETYNHEALENYYRSMVHCKCGRKFEPDRFEVHAHSCHSLKG